MEPLYTVVAVLCLSSVLGLILPMTKPDGTLDLSSLMSHIALLEQSIEDKASAAEVDQLRTDLAASQKDLAASQNELSHLTADLAASQKELEDTKANLTQVETKLTATTDELTKLKSSIPADFSGATFIRWGRTSCPIDSNIVYKGYTGGTLYTDKASSASILCLPDQPIYANHTDTSRYPDHVSHIYGTEYQINYKGAPFESLLDEDMPCALCESRSSNVIMIPARNQCYSGWTLEYSGYLLGPYFQYASGEYICVDSDAEAIPGGHDDKDGQVMYPVEGRCGSLPCPLYHDGWELTCVVCSK